MTSLAPHAADGLLDQVVSLISGNGVPVERSRFHRVDESELPRYLVYPINNMIDREESTRREIARALEVQIELVRIGASDAVERQLQIDLRYVEDRLMDPQIDGAVAAGLAGDVRFQTKGEGAQAVISAVLTLLIEYRTISGNSNQTT